MMKKYMNKGNGKLMRVNEKEFVKYVTEKQKRKFIIN